MKSPNRTPRKADDQDVAPVEDEKVDVAPVREPVALTPAQKLK